MTRPEVLAPAGSFESLRFAAAAGADAVYFGGQAFNARRGAGNFDDQALFEAVAFCHARGMRAYITLNTLLFERELPDAMRFAAVIARAGADAVIVQDPGLAALLRRAAPGLRLHASTQMSAHSPEGVRQLARMGFARVVVARELSRDELADILRDSPVEIEVFVHGALCMSVSGQCYLSALLGGRSGNRGLCAQPCRLPFEAPGGTGHDLSLKDLSLTRKIPELARMGVASLKIEGRMKRPEYVAAATAACLAAARGEAVPEEQLRELEAVFSRSGFTQGYYEARRGRPMFGARQKEDVAAAGGVLGGIRARFEGAEPRRVAVSMRFSMPEQAPAALTVTDSDGNTAQAAGPVPETARTAPLDEARARALLEKTGGTPFRAENIECVLAPGRMLPASAVNALRRQALEELYEKRAAPRPVPFAPPEFSTKKAEIVESRRGLRLKLRSFAQLTPSVIGSGAETISLPVAEIAAHAEEIRALLQKGVPLTAELPRAIFGENRARTEQAVRAAFELGLRGLLCGNLGGLAFAQEHGFAPHGDFGLNIANPAAVSALLGQGAESLVLSFEASLSSLGRAAAAAPARCGVLAYGRLPLMLLRSCPLKNGAGCADCPGRGALRDRRGVNFTVACGGDGGASELFNDRPLWMCDRKDELFQTGAGFAQLAMTFETPRETDAVLAAWQAGQACPGPFTRGLYAKGAD